MPHAFEPGVGQTWVARRGPLTLTLAAGRVSAAISGSASVTSTLLGAIPTVRPQGIDPLPAHANYLIGNDPSQWRANVPLFGRTVYRSVYPGVDLMFHGDGNSLEYDFIVQPGARPSDIAFRISGSASLRVDSDGTLAIGASAGELRWHRPVVYQSIDGARRAVEARFVRHGRRISFALGPYDHRNTLVIDPTPQLRQLFSAGPLTTLRAASPWTAPGTSILQASLSPTTCR